MQKASVQVKRTAQAIRLAFPDLFEPRQVVMNGKPSGDPRFSARLVIHNTQKSVLDQLRAAIEEVRAKAWPDGQTPMQFREPLVEAKVVYPKDPNLKDCWVVNAAAKENNPPQVVRRMNGMNIALDPNNPTDRQLVFSGMEAYVSIGFFSYQMTPTTGGIGCGLNAVLVTQRDVGRFDSRISADDAFDDVDDLDSAEDAEDLGF